ncbi:MAG: DUF6291 domain-containing protein [Oscillospiraceae bacterium]|jgi:hypothetical protein|nr:DUF6291 domain-containing protein [Oscillospiraceae bacterium]
MQKESFVVYTEWGEYRQFLTMEDKANLFDAQFDYHSGKETGEMSPAARLAFTVMRQQFERNEKRWESTRRERVEAGRRSGEARREKTADRPKNGVTGAYDRTKAALERVMAG